MAVERINKGSTKLANEIFENSTYFYRVVGKFTNGGKVAKYFGSRQEAQRAIREERAKAGGYSKLSLKLEKIILHNNRAGLMKLLNDQVLESSEYTDICDGTKPFVRKFTNAVVLKEFIKVSKTYTY